ncbi:MAG: hypothetical protein N2439_04655 [Anaerolineae bacterium]|nr:hypothetical protein [Anaerolineae bacterium]
MADSSSQFPLTFKGQPIVPIMEIGAGEELVGVWTSPVVPGVGFYKLLAKRRADGRCEWVHFTQRADGRKDKFYRGEVENVEHLADVVAAINQALAMAYGPAVRLVPAEADIFGVDGVPLVRRPHLPQ